MTNGRSQDRLPPPSSHIPLRFPDGCSSLKVTLFLETKIPLCFFFSIKSLCSIPFLYLWFEQLRALQRLTKTPPFCFFFFPGGSIRNAIRPPLFKIQSFLEPLPRSSIPKCFSILEHQADGDTESNSAPLSPFLASCPFTSPVLSSPLHFYALLDPFRSPFVHNVMLFMSFLSAVSALISCSLLSKLYIELYRDHFLLH